MEVYYQWNDSLWMNPKLANLSAHAFPSRKIWVTLNLIVPQKLRQVFYRLRNALIIFIIALGFILHKYLIPSSWYSNLFR